MRTLIISAIGWRLLVSDLHQGKTPTTSYSGVVRSKTSNRLRTWLRPENASGSKA